MIVEKNSVYQILLVDETSETRQTCQVLESLEMGKVVFTEAKHFDDGLKWLESLDVVMVVVSLYSPVVFELIQHLRADERYEDTPILVHAHDHNDPLSERAYELGATDCITAASLPIEVKTRMLSYLERQSALHQVKRHQSQLNRELSQAQATQRSILPNLPELPNVQMYAKYHFSTTISGDFYDVFDLRHGKIGILIADVTGHGISAALVSSMVAILFKTHSFNFNSTALTIQIVNDLLQDRLREDMYATVFYGIYDVKTRQITFTTAGHPPAYVLRSSTNEVLTLTTKDTLLGAFPSNFAAFGESTFQLETGDKLFIYTDGLVEMRDDHEEFGLQRLVELLGDSQALGIDQLLESVYEHAVKYRGSSNFSDDLTMLGIELLP